MLLNLKNILNNDRDALPFCFDADLSALDIFGQKPFSLPAKVKGEISKPSHRESRPKLTMNISLQLQSACDRCGTLAEKSMDISYSSFISEDSGDFNSEDTIFLNGHILDLVPVVMSAVVLEYPSKLLCKPDCKGLCHDCGADLNSGSCRCGE